MNQPNQPNRPARMFRYLALISPACLLAAAALTTGGCAHEHHHDDEVVVRERVYDEPPPPPPVVQETVIEEPAYAPPPPEVITVYERDLSPYGHWVETAGYGRCWVPDNRPGGWRPYTYGHWVSSDQGWVWVSEDTDAQFGEVCYHYGRWYLDPTLGWVWVPGSVWGPSWVAWREGGGYAAWAPLPPQCVDGAVVNVAVVNQYVPADQYYVVQEQYIGEPHLESRVVINDVTIINRTKNITNITYVNNRVVNRGVSVKNVEHFSGHPVQRVAVARVSSIEEARSLVASGRPAIYSPPEITRYVQEHPVRVVQPRRVPAKQPNNVRVDQKTAEQLKVEQEQRGGQVNPLDRTAPGQSQAERDAEAQRLREQNQRVNENVPRDQRPPVDQTPRADQKAAEDARLRAQQEQKAAQDRAAADKAAEDRAARDRAAQEKAAEEKAALDRDKAQREAQAEQLRNQQLAEQRAAQERAAQEKAAADRTAAEKAAAEKAARDKAAQNKTGQKPGDPNNPNNPNNVPH